MNRKEAADQITKRLEEGTLIRGEWERTEADGRHLACLLVAISPECGGDDPSPDRCPAALIPAWFAHLTPWIDDACTDAAWPSIVRRYAEILRRADTITAEDWRRLDYACRAIAVREAIRHAPETPKISAVLRLLDRAASGETVTDAEWAAWASAAASAAAWAAWAASAAEAAAWASAAWAAWAASASAADRMIGAMFDAIVRT